MKAKGLSKAVTAGIGARIRTVRLHLDRGHVQFAALVGVGAETVEAWESGEGFGRDDLVAISDTTGASLPWMISGLSSHQLDVIRRSAVALRGLSVDLRPLCAPVSN